MKELAEKAANTTVENNERKTLQEEMDVLQDRLKNIADETSFRGRNLLDGTYLSQEIQVGEGVGHLMRISIKSARPDQIGMHQLVSEGNMNDAGTLNGSEYATINNGVSSLDSVTIQGYSGSEFIDIEYFSSAKEIAQLINQKSDLTGVEASAKTYAKIYNLSQVGNVSFILHGASEVQISATIDSTDDLTPLYEEIESKYSVSHISPKLSADKGTIFLYAGDGEDIGIEDFDNTSMFTTIAFAGLETDAKTVAGSNFNLVSAFQDSILVSGYVEFHSDEPFILFTGSGTALFSDTNLARLPTLNPIDSIDISSQEGAENAINIIDMANTYVEKIQSDIKAYESGLESIINRLEVSFQQAEASKHRIVDSDIAKESLEMASSAIHMQSQSALITQANRLIPEYSLFLVRQ